MKYTHILIFLVLLGLATANVCTSKWSCSEWSPCESNSQLRLCVDVSECTDSVTIDRKYCFENTDESILSPFLPHGTFDPEESIIVIGKEDSVENSIIPAIRLAAALQAIAQNNYVYNNTFIVEEQFSIEDLYLGLSIGYVYPQFKENDFIHYLNAYQFLSSKSTQRLSFGPDNAIFTQKLFDDVLGEYLLIIPGKQLYDIEVSLDDPLTWAPGTGYDSIYNGPLFLMGEFYVITDAELEDGILKKIVLTRGDGTTYTIENNKAVMKNNIIITGTNAVIYASENKWHGLKISYTPHEDQSIYEGGTWTDPVFGTFSMDLHKSSKYPSGIYANLMLNALSIDYDVRTISKVNKIPVRFVDLDDSYHEKNKILVGHPCGNVEINSYLHLENCSQYNPGAGKIIHFSENDFSIIIITGGNGQEIMDAAGAIDKITEDEVDVILDTVTPPVQCTPIWAPGTWSECYENKTRVRYYNVINSCPSEQVPYDTEACCAPKWECTGFSECNPSDYKYCTEANDKQNCYENSSYSGDFSEFEPLRCDYDNNGIVGTSIFEISIGNSSNMSETHNGSKTVRVNNTVEFRFNFSKSFLDIGSFNIASQDENATRGFLIVSGFDLQGGKKTVYMDDLDQDISSVCIKDQEITEISEISSKCNGEDEYMLSCPGSNGAYSCSVNGSKYAISGLSHSGIIEQAPCVESWSCSDWGTCNSGTHERTCTDLNACGTTSSKPATSQSCTVEKSSSGSRKRSSSSTIYIPPKDEPEINETPEVNETENVTTVVKKEPIFVNETVLENPEKASDNLITGEVVKSDGPLNKKIGLILIGCMIVVTITLFLIKRRDIYIE